MEAINNADERVAELDSYIDSLSTKHGALITVLHKAQDLFGYLPEELQEYVARRLEVPVSKVYGVVTFYSFFNTKPKGKIRVDICMGTACFVRGAGDIVEEFKKELGIDVGQSSQDGMFSLDCLRCVGACGLAPVVSVNGQVYGRVTTGDVRRILDEQLAKGGVA